MKKSIFLGIASSFFFSFTFVLNSKMNVLEGSWIWSASLRYIFMLPILYIIMILKRECNDVIRDIIKKPIKWITWSTVGFGFFYAPLCFSSIYSPSWVVSATWQITIVAGAILSPLFYKEIKTDGGIKRQRNSIPKRSLLMSLIILMGVFLIQFQQSKTIDLSKSFIGIIAIIIAAFAYPLGNRKMMEVCNGKFNTFQRVFGMTVASMPFWIVLSIFGVIKAGIPQQNQVVQALLVAIFSGIIATVLFFKATDLVRDDSSKIAVVETTQAGEVIFTIVGEILVLNGDIPSPLAGIGIALVIVGMVLNSLVSDN